MRNFTFTLMLIVSVNGFSQKFTKDEKALILAGDTKTALPIYQTKDEKQYRILLAQSQEISPKDKTLPVLIERMRLALAATEGGVGIAAPQVYISKRIIIVASRPNPRYPNAPEMDAVVMVNPEILEFSQATCLGEEGCLSVPDERGQVQRAQSIKVRYHTLQGEVIETTFDGFPARIVQHEVDHLNGILFVERVS